MYVLSWAFWNGKAWTESIMASDSSLEKPRVRVGSKEIPLVITRHRRSRGAIIVPQRDADGDKPAGGTHKCETLREWHLECTSSRALS